MGPVEDFADISIWVPNEGTYPTRAGLIKTDGEWEHMVDSWGRTVRQRKDAYFQEILNVPIPEGTDIDSIRFDPPDLDHRFVRFGGADQTVSRLAEEKAKYCVVAKTGGPFLRTSFVRGEAQYLMDMAADPELALAITERVGEHLTAVGLETLRRWDLYDTGIWIFDDMAYNDNPMFSPASFERILLPVYRKMVRAFKAAGAAYVVLHSDGNVMPIMDMIVDAGIDGINPMERKAGVDPAALRRRYPHLILTGGMCNSVTLYSGTEQEIVGQAKELIDMGRDGGVVIGTHSINPEEIPLQNYLHYHRTCTSYGDFSRARE